MGWCWLCLAPRVLGAEPSSLQARAATVFPAPLESYHDAQLQGVWEVIQHRAQQEPFNVYATALFFAAVLHAFLSHKFIHWSHLLEQKYQKQKAAKGDAPDRHGSMASRLLHFLGEVEVIFGIWVVPLALLMTWKLGWPTTLDYLSNRVSYDEAVFVVIIMVIASTRPVVSLARDVLGWVAARAGGSPEAWWFATLTLGPLLGSLITEPAAMTISALLLGRQFYALNPRTALAYGTLGLLFVNVSVGGVLTHFAAPAVLMVAGPWNWGTLHMLKHFGLAAVTGICLGNLAYFTVFRRAFAGFRPSGPTSPGFGATSGRNEAIPAWITIGHLVFLAWTVLNAHHPVMVIGGFLFFVAFFEVTADYQAELQLRTPILVGFFLAGLVIHGGLQQWWISPVLSRFRPLPLMSGAAGLTAFNDNAAITYLATLVPNLTETLKHAVVAGAVAGGGLTVMANAPNPAGQAILGRYFPEGIAPLGLLLGALPATLILFACFIWLH